MRGADTLLALTGPATHLRRDACAALQLQPAALQLLPRASLRSWLGSEGLALCSLHPAAASEVGPAALRVNFVSLRTGCQVP